MSLRSFRGLFLGDGPVTRAQFAAMVSEMAAPATGLQRVWVADSAGRVVFDSVRSEEHTSELQSRQYLVCRLLLEKKKKIKTLFQMRRRETDILTCLVIIVILPKHYRHEEIIRLQPNERICERLTDL